MIRIIFPPGCYGTYLAKSIYRYTNIDLECKFVFDLSGHSHDHRKDTVGFHTVRPQHNNLVDPTDTVIVVTPNSNHYLDYVNNQCSKQFKSDFLKYIFTMFTKDEVDQKLRQNWNCNVSMLSDVPRWIMREYFSFLFDPLFESCYNATVYRDTPCVTMIDANDIVDNFEQILVECVDKLNLKLLTGWDLIATNHNNFLQHQKFHNSQLAVTDLVGSAVNNLDNNYQCQTIIEEAYAQYWLSKNGYELKCYNLNHWPASANELRKYI